MSQVLCAMLHNPLDDLGVVTGVSPSLRLSSYDRTPGSVIDVSCFWSRYRLRGASQLTCSNKGEWKPAVPECVDKHELDVESKLSELAKEVGNEGNTQVFVIIAVVVAIVVVIVVATIVVYFVKQGLWKTNRKPQSNSGYKTSPIYSVDSLIPSNRSIRSGSTMWLPERRNLEHHEVPHYSAHDEDARPGSREDTALTSPDTRCIHLEKDDSYTNSHCDKTNAYHDVTNQTSDTPMSHPNTRDGDHSPANDMSTSQDITGQTCVDTPTPHHDICSGRLETSFQRHSNTATTCHAPSMPSRHSHVTVQLRPAMLERTWPGNAHAWTYESADRLLREIEKSRRENPRHSWMDFAHFQTLQSNYDTTQSCI